jgi:hypothetical protein
MGARSRAAYWDRVIFAYRGDRRIRRVGQPTVLEFQMNIWTWSCCMCSGSSGENSKMYALYAIMCHPVECKCIMYSCRDIDLLRAR